MIGHRFYSRLRAAYRSTFGRVGYPMALACLWRALDDETKCRWDSAAKVARAAPSVSAGAMAFDGLAASVCSPSRFAGQSPAVQRCWQRAADDIRRMEITDDGGAAR